jgi:glycosyltransferase involved in cell wall biosynthesis
MNIGVDVREIQNGVITGIGRSLSNFIQYFGDNEFKHKLFLFSEKELKINHNTRIKSIALKENSTFIWDQWKLPKSMKNCDIDLFYSPYYKIPLFSNIPTVGQILDLMFLIHPDYKNNLPISHKLYYAIFGRAFARKSLSIITDSEHAKNDIIKLWNVNPQKIVVIPLRLADRYRPVKDKQLLNKVRKRLKLSEKFIMYLGNFKPHKNVPSLIKAFKKIERKLPEHKLVLAGPLDRHGEKIKDLVSRNRLINRVVFTDTVRESDYPEAIFSMADIYVFPTLYEGFGLPPLEAMACGTPVVTSGLTSVPEVISDAGVLVNPFDIDELSGAINDLLSNPKKREKYALAGLERSKQFRKERTSGQIYRHLLNLLESTRYKT